MALFVFLIYNIDIEKCIGGSNRHLANDTSLYIIVDLPKESARILDTDILVIFSDKFSKWVEVLAGVPRGSIICPFLFLIYVNDMVVKPIRPQT